MPIDFNSLQKKYFSTPEEERFYWQTRNPYIKKKEQHLLSPIKEIIKPEDKILEVGCGEGANIVNLLTLGITNNFTGVDFSEEKISFCKKNLEKNTTFICADARNLPFNENEFDMVFARDLLHHVNNDRDLVISQLYKVTKPGGHTIIIEANISKLTNYLFANLFKHESGIKDSSKTKLENKLKEYNYTITAMEPYNFDRFLFHYKLGMPYLAKIKPICYLSDITSNCFKQFLPIKNWAYWLIIIKKPATE